MNLHGIPLKDLLTDEFDFYGNGSITLEPSSLSLPPLSENEVEGKMAAVIKVLGAEIVAMVLLFDEDLDSSMYSEVGNILASRLAGKLSQQADWKVEISAPAIWSAERVSERLPAILKSGKTQSISYFHIVRGNAIPLTMVLITQGGVDAETSGNTH